MKTVDKVSIFLAELLGTGLLLFLGCGGCLTWGKPANHLQITLNFGLVVMIVIQIFGAVSGAHLNPAVTAAAFVYKKVNLQMLSVYIVAQFLGGFMGFGLLKVLTPTHIFQNQNASNYGFCTTMPDASVSTTQAFALEFVATTVLILVCCGVWDPRNAKHHDSVALRFGLAVASLACTIVSHFKYFL